MVKLLVVGLWVCGVLSGSIYYFSTQGSTEITTADESKNPLSGLDHITLAPMTIAIVRDNEVRGYVILETVFTVDPKLLADIPIPLKLILHDMIIASVHANPDIDIFRIERFEIDEFREQILTNINAKLGAKMVHDLLVQRIDFISKEDVRDLQLRRS